MISSPAQPMCGLRERRRNRAAPIAAIPATSNSPANPNGSVSSDPEAANTDSAGVTGTGVTASDAADAAPVPIAFVAVTVKVYMSPLVKPVTTIGPADPVAVCPPLPGVVVSVAVTVYPVITEPPSLAGAVNTTEACPSPAVAETPVGTPGTDTVTGVIADTVSLLRLATYTVCVVASTTTPNGVVPTGTVAVTALVAPSIT
jgi:hypothetical protein